MEGGTIKVNAHFLETWERSALLLKIVHLNIRITDSNNFLSEGMA
jgi:hypothetical protein